MKYIPSFYLRRFLLVIGLILMLPFFAVTDSLLDWLAVKIPGLDWIQGYGAVDVPWISVPAYMVLVAAYSVAGIVLAVSFLGYYGSPRGKGRGSLLSLVVVASFALALVTVLRGWLFFDDRDAVTIAGAAASLASLIGMFTISLIFKPEQFARKNVKVYQGASVAVLLAVTWAAGYVWFLTT